MASTFFPVKRALNAHEGFVADMKINFRRFRITVSKQSLNVLPFYTLFHQMGCKAMAETVRVATFGSSASATARRITCSRVLTVR